MCQPGRKDEGNAAERREREIPEGRAAHAACGGSGPECGLHSK